MTQPTVQQLKLRTYGTLIPGEDLYITRPEDHLLLTLLTAGEYCNVLSSRQMGKSSLMVQTAERLRAQGYYVATLDASLLVGARDAEAWYQGLLEEIVVTLALRS